MSGANGPERVPDWRTEVIRQHQAVERYGRLPDDDRTPAERVAEAERLAELAAELREQRERPARVVLARRAYRLAQLHAAALSMADRMSAAAADRRAHAILYPSDRDGYERERRAYIRRRRALDRILDALAVEILASARDHTR